MLLLLASSFSDPQLLTVLFFAKFNFYNTEILLKTKLTTSGLVILAQRWHEWVNITHSLGDVLFYGKVVEQYIALGVCYLVLNDSFE